MKPTTPASPVDPEFPYGWRDVQRGDFWERVPLTLEDVLHPQEGDVIAENTEHDADVLYLAIAFRSRSLAPPVAFVTRELLVHWGVAGIRNHSPDIAVFTGLSHDPRPTGLLELPAVGGRCELIIEVVSPSTRLNDVVAKFDHYFRIGIPLYVIIDQEEENGPRTIRAYRRTPGGYAEIDLDTQGRVLLSPVRLHLAMRDNHPVCFDAATGEEIEDPAKVIADRPREREQARQQREEADQAIAEQVDARHEAERQAADARKEADRQREEADRQRQEADRQRSEADKERQRREAAEKEKALLEQRARDLEALIKSLQAGGTDPTTSTT